MGHRIPEFIQVCIRYPGKQQAGQEGHQHNARGYQQPGIQALAEQQCRKAAQRHAKNEQVDLPQQIFDAVPGIVRLVPAGIWQALQAYLFAGQRMNISYSYYGDSVAGTWQV